ncbi:testis-expressed protein 2 isoform X2 [Cylas formicarius]|uniref:testis-expressed protein 2 isoform X2 n=1 Tax=Cylas formicarius TaxID=197179 RepID=UPI0029586AFC|nr:testis-expressed protein 2 isoform X2 [Cylas formicarius]
MESGKSKPVSTSVQSISIKFHADVEEIEEVNLIDADKPLHTDSSQELENCTLSNSISTGEQDTSPLKYFPKLVKRSTSVDVNAQTLGGSPPSDPWRFFSDIKGKITKNVEEKIAEIKARTSEESSPLHKPKRDSVIKEVKETSKDSSSVSDSEDISESSISKTCEVLSTTEGVEMSSDEDTSSVDKGKNEKKVVSPSHTNIFKQKFRFLRHRGAPKEGLTNINNLSKIYNINTEKVEQALPEHSDDVESAVDALEDSEERGETKSEEHKSLGNEGIIRAVAEKIENIEVDSENVLNIKEIMGEDIRQSSEKTNKVVTVFAPTGFVDLRPKRPSKDSKNHLSWLIPILAIVFYTVLHGYSPYFAGLLLGVALTAAVFLAFLKIYASNVATVATNTTISTSQIVRKIMEIPAAKEYQPLTKYEGWVNEYPDVYDPMTYHISRTQSVYLRLQGNLLRISHTKHRVAKRAMWNEAEIKANFSHHRIYNLTDARISLLPEGLAKKRHWSKKYPICITLGKDQLAFKPDLLKNELKMEKSDEKTKKSPKAKRKFTFKRRDYQELAQRFSKLTQDEDIELDSDSRESSPSPEDLGVDDSTTAGDDEEYLDLPATEHLSQEEDGNSVEQNLYIFGRTDREKEDWFRRLAAATHQVSETTINEHDHDHEISANITQSVHVEDEYLKYMSVFNKPSRKKSKDKSDKNELDSSGDNNEESLEFKSEMVLWFNALLGRVLYDCMRDSNFTVKVKERIQKKLGTIKLPYFIEEISITELSLGKTPPFILRTYKPVLDERGLWVDLDISYEGLVVVTLQTKINLMKLKNPQLGEKPVGEVRSAIYHSDVDDSAESSSDEDASQEHILAKDASASGGSSHSKKNIFKMVDRLAESKFFQAATEYRYIKKAMEGVSNTDLRLTVELRGLAGTVVLNMPPPPSDRIWIGFRPVPELVLSTRPGVGERNVNHGIVTSWIEKKLLLEFQKVMVIPNMEDFIIPVMDPQLPQ